MRLPKILCATSLGIAAVVGLVFLLDLLIKIPFERFDVTTDIVVIIACGLLIWQGIETWFEL